MVEGANGPSDAVASEAPPLARAELPQGESWNPLKTPISWILLFIHLGFIIACANYASKAVGHFDDIGSWDHYLEKRNLTLDLAHPEQPWRLLTCLFAEKIPLMALLNVIWLFQVGPVLERYFKSVRFLLLYVLGGLSVFLLCDVLSHHTNLIAMTGRSGARHAVVALAGADMGLIVALAGPLALLKSWNFWQRFLWIAGMLLIVKALGSVRGFTLDVWGLALDYVGGGFFGFAIALTLLQGGKKVAGFALTGTLLLGLLVSVSILYMQVKKAELGGMLGDKPVETSPDSGQGLRPSEHKRVADTEATPKTTFPEDDDPPEIAAKRKVANDFLGAYPPLPAPEADQSMARGALRLFHDLEEFEDRVTMSASANLEVEMAELCLISGSLDTAETRAERALTLMDEKKTSPTKSRGSLRAKRIAMLHGVLGVVLLQKRDPDLEAAKNQLQMALEWDPQLADVHFFLAQAVSDPQQKQSELKLFLDGVAKSDAENERIAEARKLLGN
jgi:membrane associated rhomboid family serine protease